MASSDRFFGDFLQDPLQSIQVSIPSKQWRFPGRVSFMFWSCTKLPSHPTKLPSHPTKLPSHPTKLPSHPTKLPSHPTKLPSHPTKLPSHPTKLPSHPTKLPSHPTKLPSHPTKLPSHPTKLPSHPTKLPSHPTKLPPLWRSVIVSAPKKERWCPKTEGTEKIKPICQGSRDVSTRIFYIVAYSCHKLPLYTHISISCMMLMYVYMSKYLEPEVLLPDQRKFRWETSDIRTRSEEWEIRFVWEEIRKRLDSFEKRFVRD